jgi:hypothetical protein
MLLDRVKRLHYLVDHFSLVLRLTVRILFIASRHVHDELMFSMRSNIERTFVFVLHQMQCEKPKGQAISVFNNDEWM